MTGKTHLAAGIATGLGSCMVIHTNDPAIVITSVICASLGSLMPDIDCETACISHMGLLSRILSKICSNISSHRRFWHTPVAGLIFAITTMLLFMGIGSLKIPFLSNRMDTIPIYISFIMFYLGYLSHLLLDSCNPQGVPWLWPISPLSKKARFKRIAVPTASNKEVYYNILCVLTAFALTIIWIARFSQDILHVIFAHG